MPTPGRGRYERLHEPNTVDAHHGGHAAGGNTNGPRVRPGVEGRRDRPPSASTPPHTASRSVEVTVHRDGCFPVSRNAPTKLQHLALGGKGGLPHFDNLEKSETDELIYTAVFKDPDDTKLQLRQKKKGRPCKLFICMTMYNESDELFYNTFSGVVKNINYLQAEQRRAPWGPGSWTHIVVCIISDGRTKIHPRTLALLQVMGLYQEPLTTTRAKEGEENKEENNEKVKAHLFEATTVVTVDHRGNIEPSPVPIQVLFCLKEENEKKINSHRWAFNAFCPVLEPNVCVLLDVGTKPTDESIYALWKAFDKQKNLGGACGEIRVDIGKYGRNLINPLVAAQNFEYKMSNILDKSLESVFGYISVLPGAFSAYRYEALQNDETRTGPLATYFKGEKLLKTPGYRPSLADSNMYLAEDRILCFEIVCKKKKQWLLGYVKSAQASTDAPSTIDEFISQRRRWMNGSFYAGVHATTHCGRILTSGQSFIRKFCLLVLFFYNFCQLFFSYFGLSSFYLAFYFLCESATSVKSSDPFGGYGSYIITGANYMFIFTLGITVIAALGNKPKGSRAWYVLCMSVFSALFIIALYCAGYTIYLVLPRTATAWNFEALWANDTLRDIFISLMSTYGLYLVSSIISLDPWHLLTSFIPYMLFLPSFIIVLTIYSFSNLQDLAWGTKGSTAEKGALATTKGGKAFTEIPTEGSASQQWTGARQTLSRPPEETDDEKPKSTDQPDILAAHYANIRTNNLILYLGSNLLIAMWFTSSLWTTIVSQHTTETSSKVTLNLYMVGIFWSVAALALCRFVGCFLYLIFRLLRITLSC